MNIFRHKGKINGILDSDILSLTSEGFLFCFLKWEKKSQLIHYWMRKLIPNCLLTPVSLPGYKGFQKLRLRKMQLQCIYIPLGVWWGLSGVTVQDKLRGKALLYFRRHPRLLALTTKVVALCLQTSALRTYLQWGLQSNIIAVVLAWQLGTS